MCLHQHGFYAKLKKCEFDKTFVELYGFILLADDEIQMDTQNHGLTLTPNLWNCQFSLVIESNGSKAFENYSWRRSDHSVATGDKFLTERHCLTCGVWIEWNAPNSKNKIEFRCFWSHFINDSHRILQQMALQLLNTPGPAIASLPVLLIIIQVLLSGPLLSLAAQVCCRACWGDRCASVGHSMHPSITAITSPCYLEVV
ncbi:hypothetical protein Y1Q_0002406 [Alligator mississippiensis]|uniref:Uncharacterized protein n=1 Tax=Alligator mississippiensis TaxID=8496 RepID=A0A151N666_ALLMI|nr:hypothetical protein Y1Q_0002406 [Alligator mississippiensis]